MEKKKPTRGPLVYVLFFLLLLWGMYLLFGQSPSRTIDTSDGLALLRGGTVEKVEITEGLQKVTLDLTEDFTTTDAAGAEINMGTQVEFFYVTPQGPEVVEAVRAANPAQGYNSVVPQTSFLTSLLSFMLPLLLLLALFWWMSSRIQGGAGMMRFGKSKAKMVNRENPQVTFADVAGVDEAVEELQEIREFLSDPGKFQSVGAKIPKGVLLYGPPGTGKTLLARAVAG